MKTRFKVALLLTLWPAVAALADDVKRYPLPNGNQFPIAQAVEVSAGTTLIFHSGTVPSPKDPKAAAGSGDYWGDTRTQAMSVFNTLKASLDEKGLGFGDVIKMTAFLVGDPAKQGRMDFQGFMDAYTQFFGTSSQPNLPARSAVQVAALAQPGIMVEVEVILARPPAKTGAKHKP
ncbi:MAG TPA: RidA family protein [Steroidobacteraceae bacterium]|jgi:enamine deaminase RidA (YjgF/YER057c/UK114 family)|nr:RidA family protein [Steroidobacteraceae bacterium]